MKRLDRTTSNYSRTKNSQVNGETHVDRIPAPDWLVETLLVWPGIVTLHLPLGGIKKGLSLLPRERNRNVEQVNGDLGPRFHKNLWHFIRETVVKIYSRGIWDSRFGEDYFETCLKKLLIMSITEGVIRVDGKNDINLKDDFDLRRIPEMVGVYTSVNTEREQVTRRGGSKIPTPPSSDSLLIYVTP